MERLKPAFAGLHAPLPLSAPLPAAAKALPSGAKRRRARPGRAPCLCVRPSTTATSSITTADVESRDNEEKQYVPLHVHSDFSLLDGASQVGALAKRAAELGVPALALTDHGVLYGAVALLRACGDAGVKPVIGNEMYVVNGTPGTPPLPGESAPRRYHLVVLAKNSTGYRNLVKLTSMAHLHGKVGKGIFARPSINKAALYQHREGLIVSSGCLGGEIAQAVLQGNMDVARDVARWFRDVFGDDYYLEIQDHGYDADVRVNKEVINIGRELGIKVVATNDSHFTSCLDAEAHDALICIQTGKMLKDEKRMRYAGNEYFKSIDEMRECFVDHLDPGDVDDALRNTLEVAGKVEEYDLFGATRIPHYPVPSEFGTDQSKYLRHVTREGLRVRFAMRQSSGLASKADEDVYAKRLEFELDMIERMGFSSYFLVVWDYIRYAKEQCIPVGPGRGSAAGSLVAFSLRITDVDPIPFNLLFERFLNPERKSMPDIDTDFSVEGREQVIKYVTERYGQDRVAQIITFNRLTSKAVLKDMARVHSVPYSEADKLAKMIPVLRGKPATLSEMLADDTPNPEFKKRIEQTEGHKEWIDKARRIEGANKTYGIHAAGVVISSSPLTDAVPLSIAKHGETITQYPMEDVESMGLLKMDFLGLKNLTVIEYALKFINAGRRRKGIQEDLDFSVDALPLDDPETFNLLAVGELDGIFQLDASLGMRNIVRELKPSSLEDISAILALYRPGPLDAGLIPKFIRRKHGEQQIDYDHPLLEPILKETYGVMVYQEQIMRIARDLAGYTLGQADILRRAMGKKKVKDMEKEKPRFIAGAVDRGVPEATATKLFEMMIQFAEYCFNKSHSTAYAYLTYQTAYLKANYPVEYAAALLRSNMTNSDKLVRYLSDAKINGVKVLPPSINRSELGFTVHHSQDGEDVVLFGLEAVKTVGASVSEAVINERRANGDFTSIIDLVERVNSRVLNKRSMGALVLCGAFDDLHGNRKILSEQLDDLLNLRRKLRDRRKRRAAKELSEEDEQKELAKDAAKWEDVQLALEEESRMQSDFTLLEKLSAEKSTLGFYASGHPLYDLDNYRKALDCTPIANIVDDNTYEESIDDMGTVPLSHASHVEHGDEISIVSIISELNLVRTARGKSMAKWMIEDQQSRIQGIVFPSAYTICEQTRPRHQNSGSFSDLEVNGDDGAAGAEAEETKVVQQDARVVVWGRVDRESSGNIQLFIDDVQRVEDVEAVVVTATHDPLRCSQTHGVVLRRFVGEFLGVRDSPKGMSYTYEDKSGNQITRQRRPSKVDFETKRRRPCILRVLAEDGSVDSYSNMGNQFRFGDVSADELCALSERTGMRFEVMNAFDNFKQHSHSLDFKVSSVEETGDENEASYAAEVQSNNAVEEPATDFISLSNEVGKAVMESEELAAVSVEEEPSLISSLSKLDEEKESFESILEKFGKKKVDYPYLTDQEFEQLARQSVFMREQFDDTELAESVKSYVTKEEKIAAPIAMHDNLYATKQRKEPKPKVLAGVGNEMTRSLASEERAQSPIDLSSDSYPPLQLSGVSSDGSRSPLEFSDPPSKEDLNKLYSKLANLERNLSYVTGELVALRQNIDRTESFGTSPELKQSIDLTKRVRIRPGSDTLSNISDSLRVTSAVIENGNEVHSDPIPSSLFMSESADRIIANASHNVIDGEKVIRRNVAHVVEKQDVQNAEISKDSKTSSNASVSIGAEEVSFSETAHCELDFIEMWKTSSGNLGKRTKPERNRRRIGLDETSQLLDLICFVASDAVCEHYEGSFQLILTSKFDFSKWSWDVPAKVNVTVEARVASVELNCISVSVVVKETKPVSGRRKRRTCTTGTVVFRAFSPVDDVKYLRLRESVIESLNERREALVRSKSKGMVLRSEKGRRSSSKSISEASTGKSNRVESAVLKPYLPDTVVEVSRSRDQLNAVPSSMMDGGQVLLWMSSAAENCVERLIKGLSICRIEALEMLHVPHTVRLDSDWDSMSVCAKLSDASAGVVSVDVAAVLLKEGRPLPGIGTIQAVFKVSCSPVNAVALSKTHKWVPFDSSSMMEASRLLEQLCQEANV